MALCQDTECLVYVIDAFVSLIDRISAACSQGCIELQSLVLCNNHRSIVSACMLVLMLSGLF